MASGPTIVAKFIADTKDLTGGIDKAAGTATSKLGSVGKVIGGAFATGAVIKFGKASVSAAADDAESQATLAAALKNTTGATQDQIDASEAFIARLSKSTAIADDDLRPAMGNLARGFGNVTDAQTALALATDISAGTGKDLGTVSEALMKAANGQTGALSKLGIETKDGAGHAKTLDQIMGDMSKTFKGQAATAADTAAGKMRGAQIAMGEMEETVGAGLLPVLGTLSTMLATLLPLITPLAPVILPLAIAFGIWSAATTVATAVQTAFGISLGISVGWIALIAVGIAALVAGIIWAWNNVDWFRTAVEGAFNLVKAAFQIVVDAAKAVWDWISNNWPLLLAILGGPFGLAILEITRHWDDIKGLAVAVFDWFKDTWSTVEELIKKPISAAIDFVKGLWSGISSTAQGIVDWFANTWSGLEESIKKPIKAAIDFVAGLWSGISDGINDIVDDVGTAIGKVIDAIVAPFNAIVRIWNGIEFKIPQIDIPKVHIIGTDIDLGGGTFGGQSFSLPHIPELAAGAVLTSPTLFVGGEAGTEIVAPEDMLRAIIAEEGGGGHYTLNMYPRTADAADIAYGFRRLELMAGIA